MATVKMHKSDGGEGAELNLDDAVFGVEPNANCVRATLNQYRANQRSGTHATKNRALITGGGRKPWKQKGTGRARHGSIRSPIWRGGATTFGPQPRDYGYRVNRKVKRTAICSALSELLREDRLLIVEDFGLDTPKTGQLASLLNNIGAHGTALIITDPSEKNLLLSARNLPLVKTVDNPNIYDLLYHDFTVVTKETIEKLQGVYQ